MDYIKEYRSFINSYYVSEGVRITVGLTLPAILLNYLGHLSAGIVISLGASCVIMADNAGPIHHRRNAMLICDLLIFLVALATGFASAYHSLLIALIAILCFSLSMLGVYGSRASSIGLAGLFIMVLNIDREKHGWDVLLNACYVLAGGIWYTLLSLTLYSFRPYKLAQQAIGECIQATADYLHIKADFYKKNPDRDEIFSRLLKQQALLHEKQDLIRELLFKSRQVVKDSTPVGRILIIIFQDTVDFFSVILTAPENDILIHRLFDDTEIIEKYRQIILLIADELGEIGLSVKSGQTSKESAELNKEVKLLREYFVQFRDSHRSAENIEGLFALRQTLENMEDLANRITQLHRYTTYDNLITKPIEAVPDYELLVSRQEIDPKLLLDQLSLGSNVFRHSIRVSIAATLGYLVSTLFPFGHSYWIMLTIIAILKPTYSLTKKRNYDRFLGTIAGAAIGIAVIYFVKSRDGIFACMVICMVGAYSFMRTRYLIFVLLLTPYILLLLYLLNPVHFRTVITDRVADTGIGSGIAFLANFLILPAWEHEQILTYLINMTSDNLGFFRDQILHLSGNKVGSTEYRISRKKAFISLANLSDAFNRMLAEPKNRQKNIRELSQIVGLQQLLVSHIAAISVNAKRNAERFRFENYQAMTDGILAKLKNTLADLMHQPVTPELPNYRDSLRSLTNSLNGLLETRRSELKQGIIETETRHKLAAFKPVADELIIVARIVNELEKKTDELLSIQTA
jgi:uncharacterized membrane protein YccC